MLASTSNNITANINDSPTVGVCCKDGAILVVEKPIESKMMISSSNKRIFTVDKHIGMAVAGKLPDGRQLVSRAQSEAESYKKFYGVTMPCRVMCDRLANFCHVFSLYWHLRPLGSGDTTQHNTTRTNPIQLDTMQITICHHR